MTRSLPKKHIVKIRPKEYMEQGPSHCGVYSVKAILSAFGMDNKEYPKEYHSNKIGRITGLTLGKSYYPKILRKYGLKAVLKSASGLTDSQKLELLKSLLARDLPVMLRIGNGYFKSKQYNPFLGKILGHWITLWSYDDKKGVFYVYDSGLSKKYWTVNKPIGNTVRTYGEILRDWKFGSFQVWAWPFSGKSKNAYIEIIK